MKEFFGVLLMVIYNEYVHLSQTDRNIYQDMYKKLMTFNTTVSFTGIDFNRCYSIYKKVLHDHPEIFWLQPSAKGRTMSSGVLSTVYFTPKFHDGISVTQIPLMKQQLDKAVSSIAGGALRYRDEFSKALYIHDHIVDNTRYTLGKNCFNAYGCLVMRQAVCAGYAAAFQLLLMKLSMTCGRVSGYKLVSASTQTDHEWNYLMIDNEYYFADVTWDDPVSEGKNTDIKTRNYFCLSYKELSLTHCIDRNEGFVPECVSDRYNYYVYRKMYLPKYSFAPAKGIISSQMRTGTACIKFSTSAETQKAQYDLIKNQMIFRIPGMKKNISYSISNSGLVLTFRF